MCAFRKIRLIFTVIHYGSFSLALFFIAFAFNRYCCTREHIHEVEAYVVMAVVSSDVHEPFAQHCILFICIRVFTAQSYALPWENFVCKSNFCDAKCLFFHFVLPAMHIVFHGLAVSVRDGGICARNSKNDKYDFVFAFFFASFLKLKFHIFLLFFRCSSISIWFATFYDQHGQKVLPQRNASGM